MNESIYEKPFGAGETFPSDNPSVCIRKNGMQPGFAGLLLIFLVIVSGCQIPATPVAQGLNTAENSWQGIRKILFQQPVSQANSWPVRPIPSQVGQDGMPLAASVYQDPTGNREQGMVPQELRQSEPVSNRDDSTRRREELPPPRNFRDQRRAPFFADELARSFPKTATERVIELTNEVSVMQNEIQALQHNQEQLKFENRRLYQQKDQMNERLGSLESQLQQALKSEKAANSRFDLLSQRVQLFNERRQKQIAELNLIIDQLETQLRQPAQSREPGPAQPVTGANPYRNRAGAGRVR